nr:stage II sporulation protein M [Planctomycetota bacterium]
CADLALADAYHLPAAEVTRLHALVASAHLRFYRRMQVSWADIARMVLEDVPARLYGDGCLRVAMAAFFGVFLASMLLGAWNPQLAEAFVGAEDLASLRDMYASSPTGRDSDTGTGMSGFYIFHNVGIALSCFASGVFAGIGSLVWLVFNGLYLGLCFGFMAMVEDPTRAHFFEFTAAHGPFELTGIMLSGAAGLRMGLGMILTNGLPRMESLRRSAADAFPIMAVAAVLVAMAAPIEAFVSPSSLPLGVKRAVGMICACVVLMYLVGLGRFGHRRASSVTP